MLNASSIVLSDMRIYLQAYVIQLKHSLALDDIDEGSALYSICLNAKLMS